MIAGVLAHEVAHVEKRHSMKQMTKTLGLAFFVQSAVGVGMEEFALGEAVIEGTSALLALKYSRDMEAEADAVGMQKLIALQKDPTGSIQFFEMLEKRYGSLDALEQATEFLSTHPASSDRVKDLKKMSSDLGYSAAPWLLPFDWRSPSCALPEGSIQ